MKKLFVGNIALAIIASVAFAFIIKIDNASRLPANINSDYYMNSLPWIYLLWFVLIILIIINLIYFIKLARKK